MKLNKIKTTLLIAVLLLSTIVGLAVPAAMASTSREAKYILLDDGTATAYWSAEHDPLGLYSVQLHATGSEFAAIVLTPPEEITLDDMSTITSGWSWLYYIETSGLRGTSMELHFEGPGEGYAEMTILDAAYTNPTLAEWTEFAVTSTSTGVVFGKTEAGNTIDQSPESGQPELPITDLVTYMKDQETVGDAGAWELVEVRIVLGWIDPTPTTAYVDDVTINGDVYELEPQSLTVGKPYDISWTTTPSSPVDLDYTPETMSEIDRTETSNANGVVNFYNVIPSSAMNWKLSDLTETDTDLGPYTPTGPLDHDFLMEMSCGNEAVYFSVQPVEDYDVVVSPSSFNIESGTIALSVTVTSDGEPVGDAYVSVEFWDNEAEEFYTPPSTELLREYETQTASNGMAMFDIEVPEIAGTIYVTAGTDLGPETEANIDGAYFEHCGYTTIPVEPTDYTLTVSPSTIYKDWTDQHVTVTVKYENELVTGTEISYELIGCGIDIVGTDDTDEAGKFIVIVEDEELGPSTTGNIAITVGHDENEDLLDDYIGTSTITVATAAKFNVALEPVEIEAATSTPLVVTFFDEQNKGPDSNEENLLGTVKVTLSGPGVSLESGDYDGTDETKGDATSFTAKTLTFSVTPEQAGTLTVTFDAVFDDETEETKSLTVDVTGYKLTVDITELTVGDVEDVTVTVLNKNDIPVSSADVVLDDPELLDEFKIGEVTYDLLRICGDDYTLRDEAGAIIDTLTPIQNGNYIFPDVEFTKPASIHVIAHEPWNTLMAELLDEIKVYGEVAYEITTDPDTLVAGIENPEFIVSIVDSEGDPVTDLETVNLETVTTGLIITSGQDLNKITTGANYDSDEDEINDAYKFTEVVVSGEGLIRVFTSNNDGASIGILEVPVILPEVTILPADGLLTKWLEEPVDVTIRDPRDGELVSSADLTITITNMKAYVKWGDTEEAELTTGSASKTWSGIEGEQSFTILCHDVETSKIGTVLFEVCGIEIATYTVTDMTADVTPETAYVGVNTIVSITLSDAHESAVADQTVELYYGSTLMATAVTDLTGFGQMSLTPTSLGKINVKVESDEYEEVTVSKTSLVKVGEITIESYVAPKLVVDYSPDIVYQDDVVTVTVTADDVPVAGATVSIVDPNGDIYYKLTKTLGTCTFTADLVDEWDIFAEATGYEASDTVTITVLELAPVTDISLSVGWNLISLPLIPYDSSIESVLAGVEGIESVWTYDAGTWYTYSPGAPSDLTDMVDGEGYWISMTASATLTVEGTEMPEDPFDPLPAYPVVEGWNLVGFKSTSAKTVSEYLLGVDYVRVYEYVDGYNSLSATDYMMPGRGYWVAVSEAGTIYP